MWTSDSLSISFALTKHTTLHAGGAITTIAFPICGCKIMVTVTAHFLAFCFSAFAKLRCPFLSPAEFSRRCRARSASSRQYHGMGELLFASEQQQCS